MALSSVVKILVRALNSPTSPYTGGGVAEVYIDENLGSGTTINTADKCAQWTTSTATNTDIDIRAQLDSNGAACNFAEIVCLVMQTPAANPGTITLKPAASNAWLGLLANASDILNIPAGTTIVVFCPPAAAYAMGASTNTINVTSSSGTSSITFTVIGRSA